MCADVLVIAFDGLDRELINKFELESVVQENFGSIDNRKDMSKVITNELYASFITGKNHKKHGICGSLTYRNEISKKLFRDFFDERIQNKIPGGRTIKSSLEFLPFLSSHKPTKDDYSVPTLFERIENSKDLFISGYSYYNAGLEMQPFKLGKNYIDREFAFRVYSQKEHQYRKRKLLRPINTYFDFLMCHFMLADVAQHFWGDESIGVDEERLRPVYGKIDSLAEEILNEFSDSFDIIIFMSDHGLVTEKEHNENAFYSCNKELFGDETPHITDFHDKILELVEE